MVMGKGSISFKLYKIIDDKSSNIIFRLCENLFNERDWALDVIAYNLAFRVRKQYNEVAIKYENIGLVKLYMRDSQINIKKWVVELKHHNYNRS